MEERRAAPQSPQPLAYPPQMPTSDHDAIVTLVSEMRQLRVEVKDIKVDIKEVKNNVADRVSDLERDKLDKAEFEKTMLERDKAHKENHDDHEIRLRGNEQFIDNFKGRYAVLAILGGILVSAVTSTIILLITRVIN